MNVKIHTNHFLKLLKISSDLRLPPSLNLEMHKELIMDCTLIMLNSDSMNVRLANDLWETCQTRVCADGGANRLYDGRFDFVNGLIPTYIIGDLDSLRPEVEEHYR